MHYLSRQGNPVHIAVNMAKPWWVQMLMAYQYERPHLEELSSLKGDELK